MAGPASDFQLPNAPLFNIYADAPLTTNTPSLPGGRCNFVDFAGGHRCGCRRFWSRTSFAGPERGGPIGFPPGFANGYEDQTYWCMCSHHACYHDDARDSQTPVPTPIVAPNHINGQENERPRTNREPLTPVIQDLSFTLPYPVGQGIDFPICDPGSVSHGPEEAARPGGIIEPSMPDTLPWASLLQSGSGSVRAGSLPPIPSQCLMPSQPSSTTSSARIAYLKPFAGKGLQTLSGVRSTTLEPVQEQSNAAEPEDEDTVDPDSDFVDDVQTVTNTPRSTGHRDTTDALARSPTPGVNREAFHLLSNTVQGHEQRLENLETISFSAAAHDICHEKHDQADLRVTELESRVEEVEKMLSDNVSHASGYSWSRRDRTGDTTASVVSAATSTNSYVMDRAELQSELQTLRAELNQLQGISSFPSSIRPWKVEVVFLPFPLKNIWLEPHNFDSQRLSHGGCAEADLWTQLPNSNEPQSPGCDWAGPEVDSEWLLGRACASDNMIGQRLRSRGLVKDVTVHGPDARSVQHAMSEAFGTLFRTFSRMQANVHHGSTIHHRVTKFLGLQSPWVPLRKLHKDSRLRFLTPAEMVTPVSWDVQFLASSVVMKSQGTHRLFITHPEAYLQDQDAYENGWTWQRLRELSRVYPDSQNSQETREGDAKEECWVWNKILDESSASNSHMSRAQAIQASAQEHWRAASRSSSSRDIFVSARATAASLTTRRSASRTQSPAVVQESRASKPSRIRTTSVPLALQALVSPATSKRRVTPQGNSNERHVSPQITRAVQVTAVTKRRSIRSQSVRQRLRRLTPRYSTMSPSPGPEMIVPRGITPLYATPHSIAPYGDMGFDSNSSESDGDVDIYEDEAFDDDDTERSESGVDDDDKSMVDLGHDSYHTQDGQAPEDEAWLGIEDAENRDPDVSIHVDDDAMTEDEVVAGSNATDLDEHDNHSQGSSVPSEYPSNQPWAVSGRE
ncbi:hypothetical protein FHL15_005683 [Xylaria flabelliformis]|uniref:Uncharacterized protein n=1 Tax=Xylaria flabelliformis TaxID=2512241 RepID=A0A553HZM6_9PEZI|nr:hypothetical protein FHL15_005683 [Xylaria flabelliformis]